MMKYGETEKKNVKTLADMYKEFLDAGKTERECAANISRIAREHGYRDLEEILENGESLKAGDKVYAVNMNKAVLMMEIGTDPMEKGMLLVGSHIDSPRLDIKQKPLYENSGMA